MTNKKQPIVPVFRGERYHGEIIDGELLYDRDIAQYYIVNYETNTHHAVKSETIEISLNDGQEWYTMDRLAKLIELGLQYEYAIEQLSPPKEAV